MDGWSWMDGWINGWLAGWLGRWAGGWMDGWVDVWVDRWMGGWVGKWVGGWMCGWVGRCVSRWMDEWVDVWIDVWVVDGCGLREGGKPFLWQAAPQTGSLPADIPSPEHTHVQHCHVDLLNVLYPYKCSEIKNNRATIYGAWGRQGSHTV